MKQGLSLRRGFFVGLVGVSFGLALASGLLAVMERFSLRRNLSDTLDRISSQSTPLAQTSPAALVLDEADEQGLTASYISPNYQDLPDGRIEPLGVTPQLVSDLGHIAIPPLDQPQMSASGALARLDGEELALADLDARDGLDLGNQATSISALLRTIDPQIAVEAQPSASQATVQLAQASGAVTAFVSTATLKTLPSGREMSWVTPGLVMTEQHNPLYLDQRGYCALTFDDGPDRIKDNLIMDILRAEGVPATFFVLGNKLSGAEATIARMLAEGHEVGNHSWSHPQLTKLSVDKARSQVERTSRALEKLGAVVRVFRPPYGSQNSRVREIGQDFGLRTMLWDVDSLDWKVRRAASIRAEIANTSDRGSVVLMHSHVNGTVEALPGIIADLRAKGCTFVTASQWFDGLNGYGLPLPQRRKRVARQPQPAADPVVPSAPTTSYQWNPAPAQSFQVPPSQPASDEPMYIY